MDILKSKLIISLALNLFISILAKAQSDFRPGYIITLQNDSINGFINYRSGKNNAKKCIFKPRVDEEQITYLPTQIKSYQFTDGKYYMSSSFMDYEFKDHVFLEYIIKGPLSIFYYKDDDQNHYFAVKDTLIIELDHNSLTGNTEEDILLNSKPEKFRGQLKFLLRDQPSLFRKIYRMDCDIKDLISLAKEYQQLCCPSEESIQFEKKTRRHLKFKFGIVFSAGISNLSSPPYNIYISNYDETKSLDFKTAFTHEFGATFELYFDYSGKNKFRLQLSPVLNFVEYKSHVERTLAPLVYIHSLDSKLTTLKIPLLLKYSFYSSNWSIIPYVKLGPGYAINLSQKGNYEYYSVPIKGSTVQPKVYNRPLNYNSNQIYFNVGLGTDIKIARRLLSVGANYTYGKGYFRGFRSDAQLEIGLQF